jgi:hypothetical protein
MDNVIGDFENTIRKPNTVDWRERMKELTVTQEQVDKIENAEAIFLNLIFHQQSHIWVAEPNGGKTALASYAAGVLADAGYCVHYFNLDSSAPDLKYYQAMADKGGYDLIAPLADGTANEDCIELIDLILAGSGDLSDVVMFFDTLKWFAPLNDKERSKAFYAKQRALTRRGATLISLAHANKHRGEDGVLIPEGTGDLKSDCDNMTLFYSVYDPVTDRQTVSSKSKASDGGKERGRIVDITFEIDKQTRELTIADEYVDTKSASEKHRQESEDLPLIDAIKEILAEGPLNQKDLLARFKEVTGAGWKTFSRVSREYAGKHWCRERRFQDNALSYSLMPTHPRVKSENGLNGTSGANGKNHPQSGASFQ